MNRKAIATVAGTVVVALVTLVFLVTVMKGGRQAQAQTADVGKSATAEPLSVEVIQPTRRPLTRTLHMPATLLAGEAADLFAKVSGYIATVSVDIGSAVNKGDVLLSIDVPEMMDELRQAEAILAAKGAKVEAFQAKVTQAKSRVLMARADVERYTAEHELWKITTQRKEELRKETAISQQELDEAISKLAIARAQSRISETKVAAVDAERDAIIADMAVAQAEVAVEEAVIARLKTLMEYTTIRAPFGGVITERLVDPGAFVRSAADGTTTPLLKIANTSYIRLALDIPESDAAFVRIGTEVDIDVKALQLELINATITRTAKSLKAATRTMRAEVDLDNANGRLAPGMYAQVLVKLETKARAMMIPSKAIRVRGRDVTVLVADGGVVRSVPVVIGYDDGIWAEITGGLSGDESIITSGGSSLSPGTPVEPVQVKPSGASS